MQDIKALLFFATILERGSLQGAAEALGVTPSAVSQQLSKLEEKYGVKLIHRTTRKLTPTEAGRDLAEHCHRLLAALAAATQALQNVKTQASGDVHLALPTGLVHNGALQTALHQLQREQPDIHLFLHIGDQLQDLGSTPLDLAIRGGDTALDNPQLIARPLGEFPWTICAAPAYLRLRPIRQPQDLERGRWIYSRPTNVLLQRDDVSFPLRIDRGLFCNQFSALHQLTCAGFGLALLPRCDIERELAAGRLVVVLPEWQLPTLTLHLVTPHRLQAKRVEIVVKTLQQAFARQC